MNIYKIYNMSNEERKKLKETINSQIDIMDFASELGYTVTKIGRSYSLEEHDSVVFFQDTNSYWRFSAGSGGGAVDFLNQVYGYDHPEENLNYLKCLQILSEKDGVNLESQSEIKRKETTAKVNEEYPNTKEGQIRRHKFLMKELAKNKDDNVRSVYGYLISGRKISPDIVRRFIKEGLLMQGKYNSSAGGKTCLFIARNEYGLLSGICERGTNQSIKFQMSASNSNMSRGWLYDPSIRYDDIQQHTLYNENLLPKDVYDAGNKILLCAESSIEIMSIMTVMQEAGIDTNDYAFLSCASINNYRSIIETCELYGYKDVVVMFNNDLKAEVEKHHNWGKEASAKAITRLEEKGIRAREFYPPNDINDWNDVCRSQNFKELARQIKETFPKRIEEPQRSLRGFIDKAQDRKNQISSARTTEDKNIKMNIER